MSRENQARQIVDRAGIDSALQAMAAGLAGLHRDGPVFLAGIPTRGITLAARLADRLRSAGLEVSRGSVDISMYRDDLGLRGGVGALHETDLPVDPERWNIVLVDDVQHTGRTARAALEAVLAFGRPRRILYAVLVDRGGRELPVRPDFTGLTVDVAPASRVRVRLAETDAGEEGVFVS